MSEVSPPDDPLGLTAHLRGTGRFARDTALGGWLHPGRISLRERTAEDSLHLVIAGTRVSAHRDRYSPLRADHRGWIARYSVPAVLRHLLGVLLDGLTRVLAGRSGSRRLELDCAVMEAIEIPGPEPPQRGPAASGSRSSPLGQR